MLLRVLLITVFFYNIGTTQGGGLFENDSPSYQEVTRENKVSGVRHSRKRHHDADAATSKKALYNTDRQQLSRRPLRHINTLFDALQPYQDRPVSQINAVLQEAPKLQGRSLSTYFVFIGVYEKTHKTTPITLHDYWNKYIANSHTLHTIEDVLNADRTVVKTRSQKSLSDLLNILNTPLTSLLAMASYLQPAWAESSNASSFSEPYNCRTTSWVVPPKQRCDGHPNCHHANEGVEWANPYEDEEGCPFCQGDTFHCQEDQKCIPSDERCGSGHNCPSNEDERDCPCDQYRTAPCKAGGCFSVYNRCDDKKECSDGTDQEACIDTAKHRGLSKSFTEKPYRCEHNGTLFAISPDKLCDGLYDCPRGDDENGCSDTWYPVEKVPQCRSATRTSDCDPDTFLCKTGNCVEIGNVCDGVKDCPFGDDESHCFRVYRSSNNSVSKNALFRHILPCKNGDSQHRSNVEFFNSLQHCNGRVDCHNGEDEMDCQWERRDGYCFSNDISTPASTSNTPPISNGHIIVGACVAGAVVIVIVAGVCMYYYYCKNKRE